MSKKKREKVYEEAIQKRVKENDKFIQGFPEAQKQGGINWRNNAAEAILRAASTEFCCMNCALVHLKNMVNEIETFKEKEKQDG